MPVPAVPRRSGKDLYSKPEGHSRKITIGVSLLRAGTLSGTAGDIIRIWPTVKKTAPASMLRDIYINVAEPSTSVA